LSAITTAALPFSASGHDVLQEVELLVEVVTKKFWRS